MYLSEDEKSLEQDDSWLNEPQQMFLDLQKRKRLEEKIQERIHELENIILVFQIAYQIPRSPSADEKQALKNIPNQNGVQTYLQMKEHLKKMKHFQHMFQNPTLLLYNIQYDPLFFIQLYSLKEMIQTRLPRLSRLMGGIRKSGRNRCCRREL